LAYYFWPLLRLLYVSFVLIFLLLTSSTIPVFSLDSTKGSRPGYVYDRANILNSTTKSLLDSYLRQVDDATSVEIVIYTIPSFIGHGIKKNNQEIQDRDMLANYIFNEVSLDGITGIGKKDKDNGILVLFSLAPDAGGGSMRIEIGRGLEGNITDGTAGVILDSYLVPAKNSYTRTGSIDVFNQAFIDTAIVLAEKSGYVSNNPTFTPSTSIQPENNNDSVDPGTVMVFVIFFGIFIAMALLRSRRRGRGGVFYGGGWGGGFGGGGGGGGGGGSGGGGAGR
jgi:uncharacterized protein